MLTEQQNKYLMLAVDLLHEADRLMQLGLKDTELAGDECYAIHNAIECAADDILDAIQELNPSVEVE